MRCHGASCAGKRAAAHVILRLAVGARRDERRHALLVPIASRHDERRVAVLRSGKRPRGRSVTAQQRRGRQAAAAEGRGAEGRGRVGDGT